MTDAYVASGKKTARSSDRAVFIWGMAITTLAANSGDSALVAACIALPLAPSGMRLWQRLSLILVAAGTLALGPSALVFAAPAGLVLVGFPIAAARALLALVALALSAHHLESLPPLIWLTIHSGSAGFIVLPALVTMVAMGRAVGWRTTVALAFSSLATVTLIDMGVAHWISSATFTDPIFRLLVVLTPVAVASYFTFPRSETGGISRSLVFGTAFGAIVALALPTKPVNSIVFDEAHGAWETVQAPFGPNDFGRVVNYTYGLIFSYAERVVGQSTMLKAEDDPLPEHGILMLKMPTMPLSDAFADKLETWVRDGGRLLVVADHTDLYDTSKNLNKVLAPRFGLKLNPDAVYNSIGMPTVPTTKNFAFLFGRVDAHGAPLPWQTGTSIGSMPANAVALSKFGPSYSEPGDYSSQNRFGPFLPRTSLRFLDHVAVAAFGVGNGAVAIIFDSTPWSNFSQFKEQYRHVFQAIVHALERPIILHFWGWGCIALIIMAFAAALWSNWVVFVVSGLVLGLTVASSAQIGWAAFSVPVEGRDFGLKVVPGAAARFEFLKQLVGPGERNYARIVSAMSKYGLDPMASEPGSEVPDLAKSSRWLLIEPDPMQLPHFDEVIPHLRRGRDLAILFAPNQAADPRVRQWLASLGLYTQQAAGLAIAEDAKPGLLSRRGASLLRDIRTVTRIQPSSLLKDREFDVLLQSYTVRPTKTPPTSGLLLLSFSADQFSDDAVGEVWEGIHPSSLGRHRERQLAAALTKKDFLAPFPDNLVVPLPGAEPKVFLPSYALFEEGKRILSGRFDASITGPLSPIENPQGYLVDLRNRAVGFIVSSCPKVAKRTICKDRLLGGDAIEWMVSWVADDKGQITAVELLHERRFSGLGSVVNVVFGP